MKTEIKNVYPSNNYIKTIKFDIILTLKTFAWRKVCWIKHEAGDKHCENYEAIGSFWGPLNLEVGVIRRHGQFASLHK